MGVTLLAEQKISEEDIQSLFSDVCSIAQFKHSLNAFTLAATFGYGKDAADEVRKAIIEDAAPRAITAGLEHTFPYIDAWRAHFNACAQSAAAIIGAFGSASPATTHLIENILPALEVKGLETFPYFEAWKKQKDTVLEGYTLLAIAAKDNPDVAGLLHDSLIRQTESILKTHFRTLAHEQAALDMGGRYADTVMALREMAAKAETAPVAQGRKKAAAPK